MTDSEGDVLGVTDQNWDRYAHELGKALSIQPCHLSNYVVRRYCSGAPGLKDWGLGFETRSVYCVVGGLRLDIHIRIRPPQADSCPLHYTLGVRCLPVWHDKTGC